MSSNLHQAGVKLLKQIGRHADVIMDAYLAGSVSESSHDPAVIEKLKKSGILWRPEGFGSFFVFLSKLFKSA